MAFQECSRMQNRQRLAQLVLSGELSIAGAARLFGVSRPTAHLWVGRARSEGVGALSERSRRPGRIARSTPGAVEALVLGQKRLRPAWGAKKIHAVLWPRAEAAPICVRTVDRILSRQGLTAKRGGPAPAPVRFEREGCNQLWQIDFKGMHGRSPLLPLSVLDDCSRFCLALEPLPDPSSGAVWAAMWEVFGEYGLPECLLSDNGDCFNSTRSRGPTPLQARLWRLGVRTAHGRPAHPQTQGKVERFHRTLEGEYADRLYQQTAEAARGAWRGLREDYNWNRPHEALGMSVPGARYAPSPRKRPGSLPPACVPEGAISRKVDVAGKFTYRNQDYRAGRGLAGEWVEVREEAGGFALYYTGVRIAALDLLQV